jgi:MoxR-like ATPase
VIPAKFDFIGRIQKGFEGTGYICSQQIATTLYLAFHLDKPVLVEGPAGVGKTELAKASADYLGSAWAARSDGRITVSPLWTSKRRPWGESPTKPP